MGTPVKKLEPGLLWYIHGKAYDLAEFAKFHPGMSVLSSIAGQCYHRYVTIARDDLEDAITAGWLV